MSDKIFKKLPIVLQTPTQKEFFDATVEQLFSDKNTEKMQGFVGRKSGSVYDVNKDQYISAPTFQRSAYQLEPIAYAKTPNDDDTNQIFYQDFINYLKFNKGVVSNHDRLFSDEFYSFSPPIDLDKFINFRNYIWMGNDMPVLEITGINDSQVESLILGHPLFKLIESLTEEDFDNQNDNGTFSPGTGYTDGDVITLSNGDIVTVSGGGPVSEFTVTTVNGFYTGTDPLTATGGTGTGFELIPGTDNLVNVKFSSGMRVRFTDSASYDEPLYVEGVGRSIELVPERKTIVINGVKDVLVNQTQEDFANTDNKGTFNGGRDYEVGNVITLTNGDIVTVNAVGTGVELKLTQPAQDEEVFDGVGDNGTFTPGSGYAINDEIRLSNNAVVIVNEISNDKQLILDQNQDAFASSFNGGTGYAINDRITLDNGDKIQVTSLSNDQLLILSQDQEDYNDTGDNGRFAGGEDYQVGDTIILDNGAEITVMDVDGNGEVTEFEITNIGDKFELGVTLTEASTSGGDSDFKLFPQENNTDNANDIIGFVVIEVNGISIDGTPLTQDTVDPASGTGFELTPVANNLKDVGDITKFSIQEVGDIFTSGITLAQGTDDDQGTSGSGVGFSLTPNTANESTVNNVTEFTVTSVSGEKIIPNITLGQNTVNPVSGTGFSLTPSIGNIDIEKILAGLVTNTNDIPGATPPNIKFTSGLLVQFPNTVAYQEPHYLEGVEQLGLGADTRIQPQLIAANTPLNQDYITMERTSENRTRWSDSNRWVHIDVIRAMIEADQNLSDADFAQDINRRGLRPIIEFKRGIELYSEVKDIEKAVGTAAQTDYVLSEVLLPGELAAITVNGILVSPDEYTVTYSETQAAVVTFASAPSLNAEILFVKKLFDNKALTETNQPPRFNLYDYEGIQLSDDNKYPNSTFRGNAIFRYQVGPSATRDPVLGFSTVTTGFGDINDLVFDHAIETDRYEYNFDNNQSEPINGYYFFKDLSDDSLKTSWKSADEVYKQRVVNRYLSDGETTEFVLSVTPVTGIEDIRVEVSGITQTVTDYSYNSVSNAIEFNQAPALDAIVEVFTFTHDKIPTGASAYFEIPAALQNNPQNTDILSGSWNDFSRHFVSSIQNQSGFVGDAFGISNNFRDTQKDPSRGLSILQTRSPMLKAMLMASDDDLDILKSIELSSQEYTRYKNRIVKYAKMLINEGFTPFDDGDIIPVSQWLDEIIRRISKAREFTDAFANTNMVAWSNLYKEEIFTYTGSNTFTLTEFIDLSKKNNQLYVYVDGSLLLIDTDYTIANSDDIIEVFINKTLAIGQQVVFRLYESFSPSYTPATPSKLGISSVSKPRIELDQTYPTPVNVIVGHDGSKTPVFGDYTDDLLLEFEKRIYNGIIEKFRVDYNLPIKTESVKPGFFRTTRWSTNEWLLLSKPVFYKWATYNQADFRTNEYFDQTDPWSWNYSGLDFNGFILQGSWRNLFETFYDTQTPHLTPWEMLGFAEKPSWWEGEYGAGPWPNTDSMWLDIQAGDIKFGERAGIDPRYARPDLIANHLPVDGTGALKSTPLECIGYSGSNPTLAQQQAPWKYGDIGPVEHIWMSSESYPYHIAHALYLARPAAFSEQLWDPEHLVRLSIDKRQVVSDENGVYKRVSNRNLVVDGELQDGEPTIQTGYQVLITSRLRSLNKDITLDFGDKIRTLDAKLGHKVSGFTNQETLRVFASGINTSSLATNLLIPSENINVDVYTSLPVREYFYGGVLVKALGDGTYQIFGYDSVNESFKFIPRTASPKDRTINVGGTPASFTFWETRKQYKRGDIVKLNATFYQATVDNQSTRFDQAQWNRLPSLPTVGGITVTYKPVGTRNVQEFDFGTILPNPQSVFDFIIGYGEYLESQGFVFDNLNAEAGRVNTWFESGREFLFWASTQWEPDSVITLSPSADKVVLRVKEGYPSNVERIVNGAYSILDQNGVAIDPKSTRIQRNGREISCVPLLEGVGIFSFRVNTTETESIISIDNVTDFDDIIYDPVFGVRQERLLVNGIRTLNWTGKLEAGGYLITADGLVPNFENLVNSIRLYHDTESDTDSPQIEDVARHLIGYNDREYFNNIELTGDNQYLFYQGLIREKGTVGALEKLQRSNIVSKTDDVIFEAKDEWALRLGEYGPVCDKVTTEFLLRSNEIRANTQLVQLTKTSSSPSTDDIVRISIDDNDRWITKPGSTACLPSMDLWPLSEKEFYNIPNAGYVHLDDVDYSIFSESQLSDLWNANSSPNAGDTIHIARNSVGRWNVYSVQDADKFKFVELQSIQGTTSFSSSIGVGLDAKVSVKINTDGTLSDPFLSFGGQGVDNELDDTNIQITSSNLLPSGNGSGAVLGPLIVSGGEVTGIGTLIEPGSGYGIPFTQEIEVPGAESSNAILSVTTDTSGRISDASVVTGGVGYINIRQVVVPGGTGVLEIVPTDGAVTGVNILNTGSNYSGTRSNQAVTNVPSPSAIVPAGVTVTASAAQTARATIIANTSNIYDASALIIITGQEALGLGIPGQLEINRDLLPALGYGINPGVEITLGSITVDAKGLGYVADNGTGNGTITLSNICGLGGSVELSVVNHRIDSGTVIEPGSGYNFSDPTSVNNPNNPNAPLSFASQLAKKIPGNILTGVTIPQSNNFGYIADNLSRTGTITLRNVRVADGSGATVILNVVDNRITSGTIRSGFGGANYNPGTHSIETLIPVNKTTAQATIQVDVNSNGGITNPRIINAGRGYFNPSQFNIVISGVSGTGGRLKFGTSTARDSNGNAFSRISNIAVVSAGTGYGVSRTLNVNAPIPSGAPASAILQLQIDNFGKVSGVSIVSGGQGYSSDSSFSIQSPQFNVGGTGARVGFTVDGSGSLTSATVIDTGENYLPETISTLSISGDNVINQTYTFSFNGVPITFTPENSRSLNAIRDVVNAQTESLGITVRVVGDDLIFRSTREQTLTITASTVDDSEDWIDETGIEWFEEKSFDLKLNQADSVEINGESLAFPSGSTAQIISDAINDANLLNIKSSVTPSGRLSISSSFNDKLTIRGSVQPLLIASQDQSDYIGNFEPGINYSVNDLITMSNGAVVKVTEIDSTTNRLIETQDEEDFDGVGDNGTFSPGTGYDSGDLITLSNGDVIKVVTADTGNDGEVLTFSVFAVTGIAEDSVELTQSSVVDDQEDTSNGSGFTLTPGIDNLQIVGEITEFVVESIGIPVTQEQLTQTSVSPGNGNGFTLTPEQANLQSPSQTWVDDIGISAEFIGGKRPETRLLSQVPGSIPGLCLFSNRIIDDTEDRFLNNTVVINNELYQYELIDSFEGEWFYTLTQDELPISDGVFNEDQELPVEVFYSLRYTDDDEFSSDESTQQINAIIDTPSDSDYVWIDEELQTNDWVVTRLSGKTVHRKAESLVKTELFDNCFVYDSVSQDTIVKFPVYDPYKGLIPGPADANITYKTFNDPARYNNTDNSRLFDENFLFGRPNVGETWWDLSSMAYYLYEQGTIRYRRNNWGRIVPGSSINVYEWVRSTTPPESYTGEGEPKNNTDYVSLNEINPITNRPQTFYYFWVRGLLNAPSLPGRTLSVSSVANLIRNPTGQGFNWFSPVSEDAFVISTGSRIFSDSDNILQINYRRIPEENKKHVEWELAREDDIRYQPNLYYWDRITDSLSGITGEVPLAGDAEFNNTSLLLNNYGDALVSPTNTNKGYLPVPDTNLSETNKYGIQIRPRQTMFVNMFAARKIFVDKVNELVSPILLRDFNSNWDAGTNTTDLWEWVDWWEDGFSRENASPSRRINSVAELSTVTDAFNGEVILVLGQRRSLYIYREEENGFKLIYREKTRLQLKSNIYTDPFSLQTAIQLRELINAIRSRVLTDITNNQLFFAILNYTFSEQDNIDWAFKTTFTTIIQGKQLITTDPFFTNEPTESINEYVREAIPYHTQVRQFITIKTPEREDLPGRVFDEEYSSKMKIWYDRFRCSLSVVELRIAKSIPNFNGYVSLDNGAGTIDIRLGAAGRLGGVLAKSNLNIPSIPFVGSVYSDYFTSNVPVTTEELEAVAEINTVIRDDMRCFFEGVAHDGFPLSGTVPWDFLTWDSDPWDGSIDPLTTNMEASPKLVLKPNQTHNDYDGSPGRGTFVGGSNYAIGDRITLINRAIIEINAVNTNGSVTEFVISKIGKEVTLGDTLTPNIIDGVEETSGIGTGFSITLGVQNITASMLDPDPIEEFTGTGTLKTFTMTNSVPNVFLEVLVNNETKIRNVDYFFIDNALFFVTPPAAGAKIELFSYIDAGQLNDPIVKEDLASEVLPLAFNETLSINVNRTTP